MLSRPLPNLLSQKGFTLFELLIAIALFSLLGIATYRMFESVLRTDKAVRDQEQTLRELSRAILVMERDLLQIVPRSIRDGYGDRRDAFFGQMGAEDGSFAIELTRNGWRNPTGMRRSNLQRVRWRLAGQTLERVYWGVLDRDIGSQPRVQRVLEGVLDIKLRYLDEENVWHQEWPPSTSHIYRNSRNTVQQLPKAIELNLEHVRYGGIRCVFRLPDGLVSKSDHGEGLPNDGRTVHE